MTAEDYIRFMPAWIRDNPRARELWIEGAGEFGYENALEYVQQQPEYDTWFPGNRRDDGSLRLSEDSYLSTVEAYRSSLLAVGVNPDLFENQYANLIAGDVSNAEFWQERVKPMYDRIVERGEFLMERYAADYGIETTREALIAAALDPTLGSEILQGNIALSEIRAAGDRRFGQEYINQYSGLTDEMFEFGVDAGQANQFFARAESLMPTLEVLAQRHADPDDTFDLNEFASAEVFADPSMLRRINRLRSQETSLYSGSATSGVSRSRSGTVSGLDEL